MACTLDRKLHLEYCPPRKHDRRQIATANSDVRHLDVHTINYRFVSLAVLTLLLCLPCHSQILRVGESHVAANVPGTNNFRPFLIRDLSAHLKPIYGDKLTVDYELLRDGPTQSGIAYPKFYLWLRATNAEKTAIEGAVRVAAIDKKRFDVTSFVSRADIISHPDTLARVFPQALIEQILTKAGLKK